MRRLPVKGLENTGYTALGLEERWEEQQKVFKKRDLEISQNRYLKDAFASHTTHTHTQTLKKSLRLCSWQEQFLSFLVTCFSQEINIF